MYTYDVCYVVIFNRHRQYGIHTIFSIFGYPPRCRRQLYIVPVPAYRRHMSGARCNSKEELFLRQEGWEVQMVPT